MKLGKRLSAIAAQVDGPYQSIWDCCCDHGLLGMALLQDNSSAQIHFVDCVESITDSLSKKLHSQHPLNNNYQVHCIDVFDLPLNNQNSQLPHLVIIAGVGGELTLQIIQQLAAKFSHLKLEFLVCPVRHQYQLREALQTQGLLLINESLIEENRRFYELIHLANYSLTDKPNSDLAATGSILWQPFSLLHRRYLAKQIQHWQLALRSVKAGSEEHLKIAAILADYQKLAQQFLG